MRNQGLLLAAFLFLGGILRFAAPAASPEVRPPLTAPQEQVSNAVPPFPSPRSLGPKTAFEHALADEIGGYYGCQPPDSPVGKAASARFWNVPEPARGNVQFLIALVPDPVHTHLALLFDRTIESIQQAIQRQGAYSFDRSVLPWNVVAHTAKDGVAERQSEDLERKTREALPGLLIFRSNTAPFHQQDEQTACDGQEPLFVFLVAETPTSGIRANQFQNALRIMREIRAGALESSSVEKPRLFVLGPNFSGSLDSLSRQLGMIPGRLPEVFVYSGSVTNAESMKQFTEQFLPARQDAKLTVHFASFQENDDFVMGQFLRFATRKGYQPEEIAVLSEDDTAYGTSGSKDDKSGNDEFSRQWNQMVRLHFPREISYFRSAYEKELSAKQDAASKVPGKTALPLNLEEESTDDDAVTPYAGSQTSLSQEAVILGVVSELQKHHIKFTLLLATNPIDQLFLARYLRNSYPQGRVVVTQPDLLLLSQEDSLLEGVLGLSIYPLVPGQSDLLCDADSPEICVPRVGQPKDTKSKAHQDRLFESSINIGTFNAMVGLLATLNPELRWAPTANVHEPRASEKIPPAPYAEYASPCVAPVVPRDLGKKDTTVVDEASSLCPSVPLTWLTILGHDGYWPIAALSDKPWKSLDHRLPVFKSDSPDSRQFQHSTLLEVDTPALVSVSVLKKDDPRAPKKDSEEEEEKHRAHTTPAWNIAYCLCFIALLAHAILSCTGSFLADSQMRAQFAGTHDKFGVAVMAIGAFWLTNAFVLIMCARNPLVVWRGDGWLSPVLWAPLPMFLGLVLWDTGIRRKRWLTATMLFLGFSVSTTFQLLLAFDWFDSLPTLWSTRYIHFASQVSPIPPFLFLLGAGYWWVWLSLRGMSIVDLRRPRLPNPSTLGPKSFRMSDKDGEEVRAAAHPILFAWWVLIVIVGVYIISLTVLDLHHPLQSLEGAPYDWGYCVALAVAIAVFLGCLIRLTRTWFKYKHVLTGLDRSPLREAFSRMKRLSWKSMWNPGGSTLRETYRVMSRTFENLEKLTIVLKDEPSASLVRESIANTNTAFYNAMATYLKIAPTSLRAPAQAQNQSPVDSSAGTTTASSGDVARSSARETTSAIASFSVSAGGAAAAPAKEPEAAVAQAPAPPENQPPQEPSTPETRSALFQRLVEQIEVLQIKMADTAGLLMRDILTPMWQADLEPVVSTDRRVKKGDLSIVRALGEEYAALVYVNFLQSILLQMRTLVICAAGMYVLIVCSISVYPFEPHPALQVLSVVLLIVAGAVVGFVYAEMHRDAILSRLTSTAAGELGWDFWVKFISAGAVPVFSLLAVQFPEIGRFLFSWLAPFLQSAK